MIKQSEIKYNRLIETASKLFMEYGYKNITLDEIAKEAGISKMTIYKHFNSKEELFLEVLMSLMAIHSNYLEEQLKTKNGTIEKIDYILTHSLEASRDYSMAFYKDAMTIPLITEKVMAEKLRFIKKLYGDIIREGIEKGEIRNLDVEFATDMLSMIVESFSNKFACKINSKEEIESFAENFYDFLKYGLFGNGGGKG